VQRDDHARVAGREVEHAVERVAVAVAVVVLGEGAGAAGLERLAQAREVGEVEAVAADRRGEPAAGGPDDQAAALEGEDRGEVVGGEAGDPVEAAAQQVVDVVGREAQVRGDGERAPGAWAGAWGGGTDMPVVIQRNIGERRNVGGRIPTGPVK
jgi:hypothetical protein